MNSDEKELRANIGKTQGQDAENFTHSSRICL